MSRRFAHIESLLKWRQKFAAATWSSDSHTPALCAAPSPLGCPTLNLGLPAPNPAWFGVAHGVSQRRETRCDRETIRVSTRIFALKLRIAADHEFNDENGNLHDSRIP